MFLELTTLSVARLGGNQGSAADGGLSTSAGGTQRSSARRQPSVGSERWPQHLCEQTGASAAPQRPFCLGAPVGVGGLVCVGLGWWTGSSPTLSAARLGSVQALASGLGPQQLCGRTGASGALRSLFCLGGTVGVVGQRNSGSATLSAAQLGGSARGGTSIGVGLSWRTGGSATL